MPEPPNSRQALNTIVEDLRAAGCVFAEDEAALLEEAAGSPAELAAMVRQRVAGTPLQLVLGWAEFCGLRIAVEPGVFVPRQRTEFLVEKAIDLGRPGSVVLDLCCGSGALGVALATALNGIELHAADLDPAAVNCARKNLLQVRGRVWPGDLYEPLPRSLRGRVDLLLANAPYVPTAEIELLPREARLYEERITLDGGEDGLDLQRRVIEGAPDWLAEGGHLLVETSDRQASKTMAAMTAAGLAVSLSTSAALQATVVIGTRK